MLIFEFYSGIGGMHAALKRSNLLDSIRNYSILPYDVNLNANETYQQNFGIKPNTTSLEYLKKEEYEMICNRKKRNLYENIVWLMSPPCQPFTSQGKQLDLDDSRTNSFKSLVENILNSTQEDYIPDYILLENVKNFEVI
jgi:tRNA (cytosine38-C5)-methyltransferase